MKKSANKKPAKFFTVNAWKDLTGIKSFKVLRRKKGTKITCFVESSEGITFAAQADLDINGTLRFLVPVVKGELSIEDSCLVNAQSNVEELGAF